MHVSGPMRALKMFVLALLALTVSGQMQTIGSGASERAADLCITEPTSSECSSYEYTGAGLDIASLCHGMHFMATCSVAKACNASGAGPDAPTGPAAAAVSKQNPNICQPFNHVATVCKLDSGMSRMSGCNNFNSMCVPGSEVPACSSMTGLKDIPTSSKVNSQVRSICEEMTMDGCEKCMPSWEAGRTWADCDLLDVYGSLCHQMPDMSQCSEWHAMCQADPTLIFCHSNSGGGSGGGSGGAASPGPVMKMYFFEDLPFYLLFKSWTPTTQGQLIGAWFAVFVLGLVYEFLQMLYGRFETDFWTRWKSKQQLHSCTGIDVERGRPLAEGVAQDPDLPSIAAGVDAAGLMGKGNCCGGISHSSSDGVAPGGKAVRKGDGKLTSPCRALAGPHARDGSWQTSMLAMDLIRGVSRFILAGVAYLLMLAAMSYHVAIFFAVISGIAVGSMLFGRWKFCAGITEGYSHCGSG